jgi:hypothetical protein
MFLAHLVEHGIEEGEIVILDANSDLVHFFEGHVVVQMRELSIWIWVYIRLGLAIDTLFHLDEEVHDKETFITDRVLDWFQPAQ